MIYKNILLVSVSIACALVCAEAVLRASGFPEKTKSGWGWQESPGKAYSNHIQLNTNQFGLRGQDIDYRENDYVVLLVGDSQVEAYASKPDLMPEKILQESLEAELGRSVRVFSLASSGWGQDQQLLALQRYFDRYTANLVLVWPTPANDFWENTFPDRGVTKAAGHLKPTFKLKAGNLTRVHYPHDFYYRNSALVHLLKLLATGLKDGAIEQIILDEWMKNSPYRGTDGIQDSGLSCDDLIRIDQTTFYREIFSLDPEQGYLITTEEIFARGRSHFSPYSALQSAREIYQIEISKSLFAAIEKTAKENGADYFVFYPLCEDMDRRSSRMVKCIKVPEQDNGFPVTIDYVGLLEEVVAAENLVVYGLDGKNELSVSVDDRHLGDLGNEQAMQRLSMELGNRLRKPGKIRTSCGFAVPDGWSKDHEIANRHHYPDREPAYDWTITQRPGP